MLKNSPMELQVFDVLSHYPDFLECLAARHAKIISKFSSSDEQLHELREIRDAVERLKRFEYAFCTDCLSPIHLEQLLLSPYTKQCGACVREQELQVKAS